MAKQVYYSWGLWTYLSIYKRDNFTCQDCGRVWKEGDTFNIHHILPRSKGGGDELDNLILLCKPCHMRRHTKEYSQLVYEDSLRDMKNANPALQAKEKRPHKTQLEPLNKVFDYYVDPIGISLMQAAELLGVSKPTIYKLMEQYEDFPACKLDGRVLVNYKGLREWFDRMGTR